MTKENGDNLAAITKNATINNFNQINANESVSRQLLLRQESESNSNINILAMAASAASVVRPTAPRGLPSPFTMPSNVHAPLDEIDVNTLPLTREDSSPLTASTQNDSSRGDVEHVIAAVSTSNAAYQVATDGAYLSVPESTGLRIIGCVNEDAHDLGYDSDGELGPFFDAVENEQAFEYYEEEAVGESAHTTPPPPPLQVQPNNMAAPPRLSEEAPNLSEEIIRAMKVPELRDALKSRNKAVRGNKDALIQRLLSCMNENSNLRHGAAAVVTNDNQQPPTESHHEVRWRLLEPGATPLQEPNTIPGLVAPTTHAAGTESEAKKYDYEEVFDRDPFTALSKEWVRNSNGTLKTDRNTGEPLLQDAIHEKGRPKWSFLKQNQLTVESHPAEWFFSLLPEKKKSFHPANVSTMEGWTMYTNLKAMLAQAGHSIYKGFEPFNTDDMKRFIGLLMFHGLAPSP